MNYSMPNITNDVETGSPHWYISYNSYDISTYGDVTTAVVIGQMELFLILNGDHRNEIREVIESKNNSTTRLRRVINYVKKNKKRLNKYSDKIF